MIRGTWRLAQAKAVQGMSWLDVTQTNVKRLQAEGAADGAGLTPRAFHEPFILMLVLRLGKSFDDGSDIQIPSPMMAAPGVKLTDRPGSKVEIAQVVYKTGTTQQDLHGCQPYFDYYTSEIELLYAGVAEATWQISQLPIRNYEDILHVIDVLAQRLDATRPQLRNVLSTRFPLADQSQLNRVIDLGMRLWLMINTQDREFEMLRHASTCVSWDEHTVMREFITSLFPRARWELNASTSRLGPCYTVAFMRNVCGLKLEWTTSLCDHLQLDRRTNTLKVFPFKCHVARLMMQNENGQPSPIPYKVLQETLLSLDLLFPIWDRDTVSLLKREKQIFHTVGPFMPRAMTLLDFDHWRDRLLELQDVLQSPPVSWAQLWRDRRNPQQFWTFWIALVILALTIVSAITGVVQAWASLKALNLAIEGAG